MKIIREINRGGFGRVEEVELPDGSRAARKVFAPAFPMASEEERKKLIRRFQREARVQASLNSNAFVPITGEGLGESDPYYLMPLAEKNLWQEIQESKTSGIAPQKALADVLNALDELHELEYVHRDLKPANVLLLDNAWRLSDFGLVLPPNGTTTKLTSLDSNWGTEGYCAPEQTIEFRNATPLVDIYAFGCILHDIYGAGPRVPYQRHSAPGEIGAIIEKCTETRPEKRFQSVQALRGALLTLLSQPTTVTLSPAASDWVAAVQNATSWDKSTIERFIRFALYSASENDLRASFVELSEEAFNHISSLDVDLFKTLAGAYCDWIQASGFGFDFCDVLIRRLEKVFALGDLEVKASAALAAAELGRSHNRWFVMGRVLHMCGNSLDDAIARRIAIEINAQEAQQTFASCAEITHRPVSEFHPRIAALLT